MAVINQNARNEKNRHPERNRSTDDLLKSEKTCPEETIYQIGTMAQSVSSDVLEKIVTDFMAQMKTQFGSHVHVLNWALHLDESTPHIHERHVFDCENRYGDPFPQQEKALEAMGIPLPDPSKPKGKNNNRKMTFDARCRSILFNIAQSYGLPPDQEAVYGGRCYLEKQDYILAKQQNELQELTLKVADTQTLIKEVSTIAYQEAVEVVADKVRIDTQQEYLQIIAKYQRWMASPERNMPQPLRQTICKCLDVVMKKITKATARTELAKKQLLEESTKQHGIAQVQRKAKESVLARLAKRTKPVKNQSDPKPVAWKEQR